MYLNFCEIESGRAQLKHGHATSAFVSRACGRVSVASRCPIAESQGTVTGAVERRLDLSKLPEDVCTRRFIVRPIIATRMTAEP